MTTDARTTNAAIDSAGYTDGQLDMLERRIERLEDRVLDIWHSVDELRGELRELAWQIRRDR